jgi:hypothetical protein
VSKIGYSEQRIILTQMRFWVTLEKSSKEKELPYRRSMVLPDFKGIFYTYYGTELIKR